MRWRRSRPDTAGAVSPAAIAPPIEFDADCFQRHFRAFVAMADEEDSGPDAYFAALGAKQERIARSIEVVANGAFDDSALESLVAEMFTVRRRLFPVLRAMGYPRVGALVRELMSSQAPAETRLQAIVDALPSSISPDPEHLRASARLRRAAWDFGAELLHFSAPMTYPLMCRWVWDGATHSGALRELTRADYASDELNAECTLATFQSLSDWIFEQLRVLGIYREFHWWTDLVLAQAYVGYLGAAAQGHFGADFARGAPAKDQLRKLLGIDPRRGGGRSRVNRDVAHVA